MRRAWRRPSWPLLLWCAAWALLGCVAVLGLGCGHAVAQEAGGASAPVDPLVGLVSSLLGSSPTTAVLVALAGVYFGGPRMSARLGLGPDPQVQATLARHDERSRETRREVRALRRQMHWQAQVLTAIAAHTGTPVPAPPPPESDPDSDEPEKVP